MSSRRGSLLSYEITPEQHRHAVDLIRLWRRRGDERFAVWRQARSLWRGYRLGEFRRHEYVEWRTVTVLAIRYGARNTGELAMCSSAAIAFRWWIARV